LLSSSSIDEDVGNDTAFVAEATDPPPVTVDEATESGGGPDAGLVCVVADEFVAAWVASGIVLRPCRQSNTQMFRVSDHRAVKCWHLKR